MKSCAGNDDEMRRISDEDTARETGPAGSNQVTSGREGIFAQRFSRSSAAPTFLPAKGARARSEHAQRNHEGREEFLRRRPFACIRRLSQVLIYVTRVSRSCR